MANNIFENLNTHAPERIDFSQSFVGDLYSQMRNQNISDSCFQRTSQTNLSDLGFGHFQLSDSAGSSKAHLSKPAADSNAAAATKTEAPAGQSDYVAQKGDSYWHIAKNLIEQKSGQQLSDHNAKDMQKVSAMVDKLVALNGKSMVNGHVDLKAGETVKLPTDTQSASAAAPDAKEAPGRTGDKTATEIHQSDQGTTKTFRGRDYTETTYEQNGNQTVTTKYNSGLLELSHTDASGNYQFCQFDKDGRMLRQESGDSDGNSTTRRYDRETGELKETARTYKYDTAEGGTTLTTFSYGESRLYRTIEDKSTVDGASTRVEEFYNSDGSKNFTQKYNEQGKKSTWTAYADGSVASNGYNDENGNFVAYER
jgi:hypothetical protein